MTLNCSSPCLHHAQPCHFWSPCPAVSSGNFTAVEPMSVGPVRCFVTCLLFSMISGLPHVGACSRIISYFICLAVGSYLGCSCILVTMNIGVYKHCMWNPLWVCICIFRTLKWSSSVLVASPRWTSHDGHLCLCALPSAVGEGLFPSSPARACFHSNSSSTEDEVVSCCGLLCVSLVTSDVTEIFLCAWWTFV